MKLPFTGEMMTCALCARQQQSDPHVESGWTIIALDGVLHYVCPDCIHGPARTIGYARRYRDILFQLSHRPKGPKPHDAH